MKKNKIARNSAIAILLLTVLLFIPTIVAAASPSPSGSPAPSGNPAAGAPGTGDTDASSDAPGTGDTDSSTGDNPGGTGDTDSSAGTPPGTGDTDSSAGTPPGTGDTDSSTGGTPPGTGDTDSSTDTGNGGDNDENGGDGDNTDNGGSPSSSSGSRSGGRGGGIFIAQTANVVSALDGACPLITTYMRLGRNNNPVEVSKLQAFLKNREGLDVDVTGTFDLKTDAAVRAFQTKYQNTVLLPWGGPRTSGYVYITTSKKINELACAQPLVLSASELAIINAFRARLSSGTAPDGSIIPTDGSGTTTPEDGDTMTDGEFGSADETDSDVATASRASILSRFWNFIVNLFR